MLCPDWENVIDMSISCRLLRIILSATGFLGALNIHSGDMSMNIGPQ